MPCGYNDTSIYTNYRKCYSFLVLQTFCFPVLVDAAGGNRGQQAAGFGRSLGHQRVLWSFHQRMPWSSFGSGRLRFGFWRSCRRFEYVVFARLSPGLGNNLRRRFSVQILVAHDNLGILVKPLVLAIRKAKISGKIVHRPVGPHWALISHKIAPVLEAGRMHVSSRGPGRPSSEVTLVFRQSLRKVGFHRVAPGQLATCHGIRARSQGIRLAPPDFGNGQEIGMHCPSLCQCQTRDPKGLKCGGMPLGHHRGIDAQELQNVCSAKLLHHGLGQSPIFFELLGAPVWLRQSCEPKARRSSSTAHCQEPPTGVKVQERA